MIDDERIFQIAHRKAWRYKFSCDPHHSDTYTFNAMTLVDFVRAIEAEGNTRISTLEREHAEFFERWHIERRKREALELVLIEAREMVDSWAAYAPQYFREKHNIEGDLAKLDAAMCAPPMIDRYALNTLDLIAANEHAAAVEQHLIEAQARISELERQQAEMKAMNHIEQIEWFRPADQLPDDDTTVLFIEAGEVDVFMGYVDASQWRAEPHGEPISAVAWWAHLPEGPKQ